MSVRVTALLNAYIRVTYLEQALMSILGQESDHGFELVLLNGPEDWPIPPAAARLAADKGIDIVPVTRPSAKGQAFSLGAQVAHGDVVAILDDDDLWEPGKMAAVETAFDQNPKLALFHNGQTFVNHLNRPLSRFGPDRRIRHPSTLVPEGRRCLANAAELPALRKMWPLEPFFNNSSISIRRSVLDSLDEEVFPLAGGEDTFLFLCALATGGDILATSDRLTRYRVPSPGSATGIARSSLARRADDLVDFGSRHRDSLLLTRGFLSDHMPPVVSDLLAREEAYYAIMGEIAQPFVGKRPLGRDVRTLLSTDVVPPSIRELGAALLGVTCSISSRGTKLAFLAWRMTW